MTDALSTVASLASLAVSAVTLLGGAVAIGKVLQRVDHLDEARKADTARLDELEDGVGGGDVSRADIMARLTQVERNTQAVTGLSERVTRLETSTEIHHADITSKLASLERGQQGIHRMLSNAMAQAAGGKMLIMQRMDDDGSS